MSQMPIFVPQPHRRDPWPRLLSGAALLVSLIALVFSMGGLASSKGKAGHKGLHPHGVVRLNGKGKIPLAALPAIPRAKNATKLGGAARSALTARCPVSNAIDLGTWCLESTTFRIPPADAGKNNYLYAAQKCVKEGGWLPSAAQLIGAAPKASLKSTIDDDPATSATNEIPEARAGIKDEREMTGDLFTTTAGSRAAGSEGVTPGSKGTGNVDEPDPVPAPAEPMPETLDYVTVYDNHNIGGFAGGEPVGKAENFRCAYAKGSQGKPRNTSSRS
jgi:hypothetical protein